MPTKTKTISLEQCQKIHEEAMAAGHAAAEKCVVVPMVVQQHANPLDDNSPVRKQWFVPDGVCGFAWIVVRPGNCKFAKFLMTQPRPDGRGVLGHKNYEGGVALWVSDYNQSMQRKEAHAKAYADVLCKHGIKAYSQSRMD